MTTTKHSTFDTVTCDLRSKTDRYTLLRFSRQDGSLVTEEITTTHPTYPHTYSAL